MDHEMSVAGVVLCGGASRRMGTSKAALPFGDEIMLPRVLRLLGDVVDPLLVVSAPRQTLPELPEGTLVVRDRAEGRGPLEGLYGGLRHLRGRAEAAYVTGCDVPLLRSEFVRHLIHQLGAHDVVVPVDGQFHHPLAAVYRTRAVDAIAGALACGHRRLISVYESVATHRIDVRELQAVDPGLRSLMNINDPEDYQRALRLAGY